VEAQDSNAQKDLYRDPLILANVNQKHRENGAKMALAATVLHTVAEVRIHHQ
jgi:hypothetical protein